MVLEEEPFAPEIMVVPLPKGVKQPMIKAYDGVTNPLDHLRTFVDLMRLYAAPDAVMCWSFPSMQRREVRDQVATLAPRSIRTFNELSKSFVAYFMSSKRKRKTAIGLMQVVQDKEEPLQDYLARFSWATLGIKDLQMSVIVTALMNGTRNLAFNMSLSKNPSELVNELLKKGDKYVDAEEAERVTRNLREGREPKTHKRKDRSVKQRREEVKAFTPLIVPRSKVLMEIRVIKELDWPKPMAASANKRDKSSKQKVDDRPPPRVGVINVITRGIVAGEDSNSARKGYARTVGVCSIQEKARVLVDGGSAANVLTWEAFVGLKISPKNLKVVSNPLPGFRGATVIQEGVVELPVTLGTYLASVVILVNFLVVKTPMVYNAIYGRPLLNAFGAIPSTYHQALKFPTSRGVGYVKGDQ
ncbi:uncharacterized protein LOC111404395 [Olea europaea var. sylvestris]|uniref:uncharacterized protein LOC111404395 n=1 Tax=Olea europaea var. sylvestris TaxID=158386 RepID=UPI000C1D0E06|nr:uncharacterized protein LOC111404395 [Olea europaea var. sylvestris]